MILSDMFTDSKLKDEMTWQRVVDRQVEEPTGPDAPEPDGQGDCPSGWHCLTQGQQFGIIFSIVVFVLILAAAIFYWC